MNELTNFTTTELTFFFSSLAVAILILIQSKRFVKELIPRSYGFNGKHFMIGLSVAISSCIALANWTTTGPKENYTTITLDEDLVVVKDIPTSAHQQKKRAVPPPPREEKATPTEDLTKLNLVDETVDLTDEKPLLDVQDVVAATEPDTVESPGEVAPIVAPEIEETKETFYPIAEQMPRFPGCEGMIIGKKEKEACARKNLMEYIYSSLKYPVPARQNGIEGLAVLQFVVTKDGRISRIKIMKDPGGGCAAAAVKVVEAMNKLPEAWTPGKQRGRPVSVLFTLPVKFKLN